jgi:hypothetical protein
MLSYSGIIEGTHEQQNFRGKGSFEFRYMYGYWYIDKVNFPPFA